MPLFRLACLRVGFPAIASARLFARAALMNSVNGAPLSSDAAGRKTRADTPPPQPGGFLTTVSVSEAKKSLVSRALPPPTRPIVRYAAYTGALAEGLP